MIGTGVEAVGQVMNGNTEGAVINVGIEVVSGEAGRLLNEARKANKISKGANFVMQTGSKVASDVVKKEAIK